MKRYTQNTCLTLVLIASCFIFSSSYGQQLKILGKPVSAAYDFAGIVAKTLKLNAPDSTNTKSGDQKLQVILKAPDNEAKWIIIDFNKDYLAKTDNIATVSITGSISDIIELYAALYDNSVKKVKPEEVYTAIDKEGEIRKIRTDYRSTYDGVLGVFGRIHISKSTRTK
jgi:hypothetical protein